MSDAGKVADVWDDFAREHGSDRRASTPDAFLVDLETRVLRRYIKNRVRLLDIGCGNGYTAIQLAQKRKIDVTGIDISPEMIRVAAESACRLGLDYKFAVGNILDPELKLTNYDVVLTKRVLINILTWKEQRAAVEQIRRLLGPGGVYLASETTVQGHNRIGDLRKKFGLPQTPIRWHNNYLDEGVFLPFLKQEFGRVTVYDFSSTYYVGSRVIQPVLQKPWGKQPSYDSPINWLFSHLPSVGSYGMQKLFVCEV
jgi:SAM-dependent methyltransferase